MGKNSKQNATGLTRRQALTGAAALSLGLAAGESLSAQQRLAATLPGADVCMLTPKAEEGPFYFDPKLVRPDITEGKTGAPLTLILQVTSAKDCARLNGARVDLWHADAFGMYSGYRGQGEEGISTRGQTFLLGTQFTSAEGQVRFATIYPGWYPRRTPHIHFKVLLDATSVVTGQLYFPDDLSARIYAGIAPYSDRKAKRDIVANKDDFVFQDQGGADTLLSVKEEGQSLSASLVIGINRAA
jgi:protocatechuate 3,4-dioxygenase beta subunit